MSCLRLHGLSAEEDARDVDVFAGAAVGDLPRAVSWFDRLLGDVESFEPNDTERVWTLGEHGHVYAELLPEHAGHSMVTLFVSDFDAFTAAAAEAGIEPALRETGGAGGRQACD